MENTYRVVKNIEKRILLIRGLRIMIDADIAELYGTSTKALNQAVKRNTERFPSDFMFQLTVAEKAEVVTNCDHLSNIKYSKTLPYAFTEHGALMVAAVLNTQRAIEMSLFVVRAFVMLRNILSTHAELARKLDELEKKFGKHDHALNAIILTIRNMTEQKPESKTKRIGFERGGGKETCHK